jgi:hypothetical protein
MDARSTPCINLSSRTIAAWAIPLDRPLVAEPVDERVEGRSVGYIDSRDLHRHALLAQCLDLRRYRFGQDTRAADQCEVPGRCGGRAIGPLQSRSR